MRTGGTGNVRSRTRANRSRPVILAALSLVLAFPTLSAAVPGEVLWNERVPSQAPVGLEVEGSEPTLAVTGTAVFFASTLATTLDGDQDLVVRSHVARTGELAWEDRHDVSHLHEFVRDLAVAAGRVFVVGGRTDGEGNYASLVRAYRAASGDLLWSDEPPLPSDLRLATAVAARGNDVFVGGLDARTGVRTGVRDDDWVLRAIDAATGSVRWEDRVDLGELDFVTDVIVRGSLVVACGVGNGDWIVRGYDATTGTLRWQDRFHHVGTDLAYRVALRGNRVFVSGTSQSEDGFDWLVRAYDVRTGGLLWQDRVAAPGEHAYAADISASVDGVFAAGYTGPQSGARFLVRAYRPRDGKLSWQDAFDPADPLGGARAVEATAGSVFVTAVHDDARGSKSVVRRYDARSGALGWDRRLGRARSSNLPANGGLAARGDRLYVLGERISHRLRTRGERTIELRALDAR